MNYLQSIPIGILVLIIVTGLLIYAFFVLVEKYYIAFVKKNRFHEKFKRLLPKVKLFFWFIWFCISVYFLLLYSPFITIVFLVGIYLFTKDFWLNIYAGVFLMNKIKEGDYIEIHNLGIKGIIRKMRFSDIEIQNDNKEIVFIPNSLVIKSTIAKKEKAANKYRNDFAIPIDKYKDISLNEKTIKEAVFKCPWTVISKPIEIEFINKDMIRISAFTFSKDTAVKQEMFVLDELKKNRVEKHKK